MEEYYTFRKHSKKKRRGRYGLFGNKGPIKRRSKGRERPKRNKTLERVDGKKTKKIQLAKHRKSLANTTFKTRKTKQIRPIDKNIVKLLKINLDLSETP